MFVGAAALVAARPLRSPAHAEAHTLLDTEAGLPLFRYFRDAPGGGDQLRFGAVVHLGTIEAIRRRVLAEAGVAVLPAYLVKKDLEAGRLVALFPKVTLLSDWFRLVFRSDDPRRVVYERMAVQLSRAPLR